MPMLTHIDEKWVDIVPPVAPVNTVDPFLVGIFVVLLFLLIALGIFFYRRPRQRAKRALRRLARDVKTSQVETKPACFQIRQCLRAGFGQRHLYAIQWDHANHADWLIYLNQLAQYCFAAETPATAELDGVIHEALAWLNEKVVEP